LSSDQGPSVTLGLNFQRLLNLSNHRKPAKTRKLGQPDWWIPRKPRKPTEIYLTSLILVQMAWVSWYELVYEFLDFQVLGNLKMKMSGNQRKPGIVLVGGPGKEPRGVGRTAAIGRPQFVFGAITANDSSHHGRCSTV
jgi:hypothetical protein